MLFYYQRVVVYVEVVLFNNLAVDFALCIATQILRKRQIKFARALICSCIGSACACAYPIAPQWGQIVIKVLLAPIMSTIILKCDGCDFKRKIVDYLGTLFVFCLLTYFVGGIVYAIGYALDIDLNSYLVLGIVALAIVTMILTVYAIVRKRARGDVQIKRVEVVAGDKSISLNALCDTGNLLVDAVTNLPVAIMSHRAVDGLGNVESIGYISVETVSGEVSMKLIKPDYIRVGGESKIALCAISEQEFSNYDIILQNSLF